MSRDTQKHWGSGSGPGAGVGVGVRGSDLVPKAGRCRESGEGSYWVMETKTHGADTWKETPCTLGSGNDMHTTQGVCSAQDVCLDGRTREACLVGMVRSDRWTQDLGSNPDSDTQVASGK